MVDNIKIIKRKEFLELKKGTVFCKYTPQMFGDIQMFMGVFCENDYMYQDLVQVKSESSEDYNNILNDAENNKSTFELDINCVCRDGCFDDNNSLIVVFDEKDVLCLIKLLNKSLSLKE